MGCSENVSAIDSEDQEPTANKIIKLNDFLSKEGTHLARHIKSV